MKKDTLLSVCTAALYFIEMIIPVVIAAKTIIFSTWTQLVSGQKMVMLAVLLSVQLVLLCFMIWLITLYLHMVQITKGQTWRREQCLSRVGKKS